jgi:hypothetical protein
LARASFFIGVLLAASVLGAWQTGPTPDRELDNIAAFARLYGVVRYFYPSDAAAALDWNRFVVDGVQRARTAADARALEGTLERLFGPLGPGIEIGATLPPRPAAPPSSDKLIAWRYLGAGFDGGSPSGAYQGKRTHRARAGGGIDGFVTLMQNVPADKIAGKPIRLRGQARVSATDSTGSGAFWLRVDRPNQSMGFFDNMGNRPIRTPEWREYVIEGTVDQDATNVAFGIMASGLVTADFDAVEISTREADGTWSVVPIDDAGFEDAAATSKGWFRAGISKTAEITRSAEKAPQGRQFARLSAPSTPAGTAAELFEDSAPAPGDHADVDLGSGLKARVPLVLSDAQAAGAAKVALDPQGASDQSEQNTRLADVVIAWNVFRHFYPYWTEAGVDWDTRLRPRLEGAYKAASREAHRDALRLLVADARDGHGRVTDSRGGASSQSLPLRLGTIERQVVVVASDTPDAPVGAVVSAIDGAPAGERLAAMMQLASGTTQWQQVRALQELVTCRPGATVTLVLDDGSGRRSRMLNCEAKQAAIEKRPDPVAVLESGVWYVDLTRARMTQITPVLPQLSRAAGVIFDVRGYPTDAGFQILPHLLDASESDRWMHVAKLTGPFGRSAGWLSVGWNMSPRTPHLGGKIVFLTDGRAISYAESVMGYVADRKLGTIVGSPTAGANGNVAVFGVPGGFTISFTGMRVTGHDGRTPHHLVGVKPDIPLEPTIAGLRAGRDEVLEKALESLIPHR